jgi:hypothetical protein
MAWPAAQVIVPVGIIFILSGLILLLISFRSFIITFLLLLLNYSFLACLLLLVMILGYFLIGCFTANFDDFLLLILVHRSKQNTLLTCLCVVFHKLSRIFIPFHSICVRVELFPAT